MSTQSSDLDMLLDDGISKIASTSSPQHFIAYVQYSTYQILWNNENVERQISSFRLTGRFKTDFLLREFFAYSTQCINVVWNNEDVDSSI
jgi:hypothetical protein